jgi:tRNA(Ile)-lysidine synthase
MKDRLVQVVRDFLNLHYQKGRPLLLGFSGGPDSLALLHLLLECRRFFPLDLHLAHLDHGWRESSGREAMALEAMAQKLQLPFYLKTLPAGVSSELEARIARHQYFLNLYEKGEFQALLLAHHADDQAETVLKRILEGRSLLSIGGIRANSVIEGMRIWRPLLTVRKKSIMEWLEKRELKAIDDPTNRDPKYLRARMRTDILPSLSKQFGKEATLNLSRLGEGAQELRAYLQRKIAPYLARVQRENGKVFFDFTPFLPMEKIEFLALCKELTDQEGILFSYEILENLYKALIEKRSCRFFQGGREILIQDKLFSF